MLALFTGVSPLSTESSPVTCLIMKTTDYQAGRCYQSDSSDQNDGIKSDLIGQLKHACYGSETVVPPYTYGRNVLFAGKTVPDYRNRAPELSPWQHSHIMVTSSLFLMALFYPVNNAYHPAPGQTNDLDTIPATATDVTIFAPLVATG